MELEQKEYEEQQKTILENKNKNSQVEPESQNDGVPVTEEPKQEESKPLGQIKEEDEARNSINDQTENNIDDKQKFVYTSHQASMSNSFDKRRLNTDEPDCEEENQQVKKQYGKNTKAR